MLSMEKAVIHQRVLKKCRPMRAAEGGGFTADTSGP